MIKLCFILLTQSAFLNSNASKTVLINTKEIRYYENGKVYMSGPSSDNEIVVKENGTQIKEIIDRECK